ncbi:hypothetical protein F5Y03DRAFT_357525 [Xylaria venustula]|nr:hypothetical protein F5Y03DRAFT_357525 [Xylaria venustula]
MSLDSKAVKGLGDFVVADIKTLVARRLRGEHLYQFIRARDDLLRPARSDDSETIRLLRDQSLRGLEHTWGIVLETLRSELPGALDQLFSKLQPEFQVGGGSPQRSREHTPLDPASASTEVPKLLARACTPGPPSAQEANVSVLDTTGGRSVTFAPEIISGAEIEEPTPSIEVDNPVTDSLKKEPEKRPLPVEEPEITSPRKRAKKVTQFNANPLIGINWKPIKRNMFLCEVEEQECVFSYSGHAGFYVLRCNQLKCRKGLDQDEGTVFTSHPFRDGVALEHFAEEWHEIKSEAEIFRRFAIRVIDAKSERNVDKRDNTQTSDGRISGEDRTPPQPKAPERSTRSKGKKPERPYNVNYPKPSSAAEASTSAAASRPNETFKESFYRAGPLLSSAASITPLSDSDFDGPLDKEGHLPANVE